MMVFGLLPVLTLGLASVRFDPGKDVYQVHIAHERLYSGPFSDEEYFNTHAIPWDFQEEIQTWINNKYSSQGWAINFTAGSTYHAYSPVQNVTYLKTNQEKYDMFLVMGNIANTHHHLWEAAQEVTKPIIGPHHITLHLVPPRYAPLPASLVYPCGMIADYVWAPIVKTWAEMGYTKLLYFSGFGSMENAIRHAPDLVENVAESFPDFEIWSYRNEDGSLMTPEELLDGVYGNYEVLMFALLPHPLACNVARYIHDNNMDFKGIVSIDGPEMDPDCPKELYHYWSIAHMKPMIQNNYKRKYDSKYAEFDMFPHVVSGDTVYTPWKTMKDLHSNYSRPGLLSHYVYVTYGVQYLVRLIVAARMLNTTDISGLIRQLGPEAGMDLPGVNLDGHNPMMTPWSGQMIDQGEGFRDLIFSPQSVQDITQIVEIPKWEDRECYPDCPPCYKGRCQLLGVISSQMMWSHLAAVLLWTTLYVYAFKGGVFSSVMIATFQKTHGFVTSASALMSIVSFLSFRPQFMPFSFGLKVVLILVAALDGVGGLIDSIVVICDAFWFPINLESKLMKVFCVILIIGNVFLVVLNFAVLLNSESPSKSTAPITIDVIVSVVDFILLITSPAFFALLDRKVDECKDVLAEKNIRRRTIKLNEAVNEGQNNSI